MLNNLSRRIFKDMSQLVRLEGKHTTQNAHCALVIEPEHHGSSSILLVTLFWYTFFLGHPVYLHYMHCHKTKLNLACQKPPSSNTGTIATVIRTITTGTT